MSLSAVTPGLHKRKQTETRQGVWESSCLNDKYETNDTGDIKIILLKWLAGPNRTWTKP